MTTTKTPLATVSKSDATEVKYYLIDGVRYATPSNWKKIGLQPKEGATGTVMNTKNGYEFTIYAEELTTKYDAKKAQAIKEQAKEVKKMQRELFSLYAKHEIGYDQYIQAMADLEAKK